MNDVNELCPYCGKRPTEEEEGLGLAKTKSCYGKRCIGYKITNTSDEDILVDGHRVKKGEMITVYPNKVVLEEMESERK